MWKTLFTRGPSPDARLEARVKALEVDVEQLQRSFKTIKLEWEETYDKLHHLMSRVTKRAKVLSTSQEAPAGDFETPPAAPPLASAPGTHARLQAMRGRHGLLPR